jgi:Flp pilus assembly protein TadG
VTLEEEVIQLRRSNRRMELSLLGLLFLGVLALCMEFVHVRQQKAEVQRLAAQAIAAESDAIQHARQR